MPGEEQLDELREGNLVGIETDFDNFGMITQSHVGRVPQRATGITCQDMFYSYQMPKLSIGTPESAHAENSRLRDRWLSRNWQRYESKQTNGHQNRQ